MPRPSPETAPGRVGTVSLATRLVVLFAVMVALLTLTAIGTALSLRADRSAVQAIDDRLLPAQTTTAALLQALLEQRAAVREFAEAPDEVLLTEILTGDNEIDQLVTSLEMSLEADLEATVALSAVRSADERWRRDGIDALVSLSETPAAATESAFAETAVPRFQEVRDAVVNLGSMLRGRLSTEQRLARRARTTTNGLLVLSTGLSVLAGIAAVVVIRRSLTRPLNRLVDRIGAVAEGDLQLAVPESGPSELATVGRAAERMRQRLLDEATRRAQSALIAGEEQSRSRIAGDIHDDQVQAMTAVSLRLQQLRRRLEDPELRDMVVDLENTTKEATGRLRRMIFELHSPVLETDGLIAALDLYLEETFGDPGADCAWKLQGSVHDRTPASIQALAYRLAQEAMWNAFLHAHATTLEVSVEGHPTALSVTVADNGVGFDPDRVGSTAGHLGLAHSRALAESAGGWCRLASKPGQGTTVSFRLPFVPTDPPAKPETTAPSRH